MKLKKIVLDALLWIGVIIECMLLLETCVLAKMGKIEAMLIAGSFAALPLIGIFIYIRVKERWKRNETERRIKFLRNKGIPIKVDLSECEIRENARTVYYDRQDIPICSMKNRLYAPHSLSEPDIPPQSLNSQKANAANALFHPEEMNERFSYDRCVCVVKATLICKGKEKVFVSEPVYMDKSSLGIFLSLHKEGFVYVNPKNSRDYFFDLDFLKREE